MPINPRADIYARSPKVIEKETAVVDGWEVPGQWNRMYEQRVVWQHDMDQLSREVFAAPDAQRELDLKEVLRQIGRSQELASRARESLVSIGRLLSYISRPGEGRLDKLAGRNLKTLSRDVMSLSDHASFLSSSINFQLDATLGLINIEQNAIIKIFSVAAVVFLPPTLVASVYGMNFEESVWPGFTSAWGFPFALAAAASARSRLRISLMDRT